MVAVGFVSEVIIGGGVDVRPERDSILCSLLGRAGFFLGCPSWSEACN